MPVTELRVENYRSIRALTLPLKSANLIVGANGCGKTNLYRSMALLRNAAEGRLAEGLLEEGGMPSALWAGDRLRACRSRTSSANSRRRASARTPTLPIPDSRLPSPVSRFPIPDSRPQRYNCNLR
ncbi:MAG: AAA family ATPase [Chthonomonadaceae bacterium]|nr:AAA family ATPase [Chthonomonadaceae bacterium]